VTIDELHRILSDLRSLPAETEWLEFKSNNAQEIGEYISALSNAACIHNEEFGYLVFGVDDKTHRIIGTKFSPNQKGKGNEDLIP
jgi:predicted HTH transcriptional regulator